MGGRFGRDGDLHLQAPEYGRSIYCDATYSIPLQEVGAEAKGLGLSELVEQEGIVLTVARKGAETAEYR